MTCFLCGRAGRRGYVKAIVVRLPYHPSLVEREETITICASRPACRRRRGMRP